MHGLLSFLVGSYLCWRQPVENRLSKLIAEASKSRWTACTTIRAGGVDYPVHQVRHASPSCNCQSSFTAINLYCVSANWIIFQCWFEASLIPSRISPWSSGTWLYTNAITSQTSCQRHLLTQNPDWVVMTDLNVYLLVLDRSGTSNFTLLIFCAIVVVLTNCGGAKSDKLLLL